MDDKEEATESSSVSLMSTSEWNEGNNGEASSHQRNEENVTLKSLTEEIAKLKLTVDGLRHSLTEKQNENKKLTRCFKNAKEMFSKEEWGRKRGEWKLKRNEMRELLSLRRTREERLKLTVDKLKTTLGEANKDIGWKEEEIQRLSKRIADLREGKTETKPMQSSKVMLDKKSTCQEVKNGLLKDAVAILPEEIWEQILANLPSSIDLWRCSNTCQLFQKLLYNWRTRWLLEQALPHLYRQLPPDKILKCRLICRGWNAGVNNFLENHPSLRPYNGYRNGDPRELSFINPAIEKELGRQKNEFIFNRDNPAESDLRRMMALGGRRNPFIGRYVILVLERNEDVDDPEEDGEEMADLWKRFYTFLESFGKHIWYLTVSFPFASKPQQNMLQFYTSDLPRLLPNLRKLRFEHSGYDSDNIGTIDHNLLPSIQHLETLEASSSFQHDPILKAMLRRYHDQLGKLDLTAETWAQVCHLDWSKLTELHLTKVRRKEDFQSLRLFGVRMPNLRKLGLTFPTAPIRPIITFDGFLEVIHELSSATHLDTLRIEGGLQGMWTGFWESKGYAPVTLKTIEVDHYWGRYPPSYNFLLRFPHLRNLNLFMRKNPKEYEVKYQSEVDLSSKDDCVKRACIYLNDGVRDEEIVVVHGLLYRTRAMAMYESNIWRLLPQLQVFSFQWEVYTRDGYEEFARKCDRTQKT